MALSETIQSLIRSGADSIPLLLEHLTDDRVTEAEISWKKKSLLVVPIIHGNVASPLERGILSLDVSCYKQGTSCRNDLFIRDATYWVRVGDICYMILGVIVGRQYIITGGTDPDQKLSSPIVIPDIAEKTRKMWASENPRQRLLDNLMFDFYCCGIQVRSGLDEWRQGSDLQEEAAARLLLFYEDESKSFILERINGLKEVDGGYGALCRENKVDPYRLLSAIRWTQDDDIRESAERASSRIKRTGR